MRFFTPLSWCCNGSSPFAATIHTPWTCCGGSFCPLPRLPKRIRRTTPRWPYPRVFWGMAMTPKLSALYHSIRTLPMGEQPGTCVGWAPSRRQRPRRPSPPQRPRLGFSRCFLFAPTHAALASGDRDSRGSSAAGAAPRAPTSSSSSAPQTPRARRPLDPPSTCPHTAFDAPASALGSRSASPPQRAVPCTAHRSHKTSRDTHHTCAATSLATPCCTHRLDARAAHGQFWGRRDSGAGLKGGTPRGACEHLPPLHTSIGARFSPRARPRHH